MYNCTIIYYKFKIRAIVFYLLLTSPLGLWAAGNQWPTLLSRDAGVYAETHQEIRKTKGVFIAGAQVRNRSLLYAEKQDRVRHKKVRRGMRRRSGKPMCLTGTEAGITKPSRLDWDAAPRMAFHGQQCCPWNDLNNGY